VGLTHQPFSRNKGDLMSLSVSLPVQNNLTALRWLAAWLVLLGHGFVFTGQPEPILLGYWTLGPLGVAVFFSISGYLVSQSWQRDPNGWRFLARRALRIFPALAVCVLLCVFVLGPALTTLSGRAYFEHPATWDYLSNIALYITYYLPGVFEHGRVPNSVNGSLWSLPAEFAMYLLLALLGVCRWPRWGSVVVAAVFIVLAALWATRTAQMWVVYRTDVRMVVMYGAFFWVGVAYQRFNVSRWFGLRNALLVLAGWLCMTPWVEVLIVTGWLVVPFVALALGLASHPVLSRLSRFDYSYGIYIYAFPVQQTLAYLWPQWGVVPHVLAATAVTVLLAAVSWHVIEQRALGFKPRVRPAVGV
jgi:peptidoglycan/LPS O-acetylase OafA/YrhL